MITPDNNSEPNLTTVGITDTPTNYVSNIRSKRFRNSSGDVSFRDEFASFKDDMKRMFIALQTETMNEIKSQFSSWKSDSDVRLTKLEDSLSIIERSNQDIEKSILLTSSQYDEIKQKSDKLEKECKEHRSYLISLEEKIEEMLRVSKINFLEIRNVPKIVNESKGDIQRYLNNLLTSINANLSTSCVKDSFRIPGKKDSNSTILIEFVNNTSKNIVLKAAKAFNQSNVVKLNSANLGASGSFPVYVTEHLTPKARKLHFLSRNLLKNRQLLYCWTSNGKILVKTSETAPTIQIKSVEQLEKVSHKTM